MNKRLVLRVLGAILLLEACCVLPAALIALICGDGDADALLYTAGIMAVSGLPAWLLAKPRQTNLRAREGFLVVALSWVLMSAFGALPFVLSGMIPNYVDAFFEVVSGFTTTGATVLSDFDGLPRGLMFWRSFTHWIGGMGVLVLTLALLPQVFGRASHLMRAESPGPSLSKIMPKLGDSAKILYLLYAALTVLEWLLLMLAGMSPYDAAIHAFGTAGTGGFSNYLDSVGAFHSVDIDVIITFFMVLFGINFAVIFRALTGGLRDALKSEELRWYLGIVGAAMLVMTLIILPRYGDFFTALRYGSFQVATISSTTGYATADFNLWPAAAKLLIVMLMFIGSCAGSTAGGMKVVRVAVLCKLGRRQIRHTFQPRKVQVVRFEGKGVEEHLLEQIATFFFVYVVLVLVGAFALSLEGRYDLETNLTAALSCISNVGPGLGAVGPIENFAGYGPFAKLVMSLLMLCGRLELFPILVLFSPTVWRKG